MGGPRSIAGWLAVGAVFAGVLASGALGGAVRPAIAAPGGGMIRDAKADLYLQNCASCHGPQGEGTAAGPSLVGVGEASADFYLRTGRMPLGAPDQRPVRQEPRFTPEEIAALVSHVGSFGGGPAVPQVTTGGDLHRGWALYAANCAACHGASGSGNAVGGGSAAVSLGQANATDVAEAMLIGPGVMPPFQLPDADRDAIVAYVQYLRTAPSPGGAGIGGFGPVSEGFVSIVVGLILVVLAVKFVGRRTEPSGQAPVAETTTGPGPRPDRPFEPPAERP